MGVLAVMEFFLRSDGVGKPAVSAVPRRSTMKLARWLWVVVLIGICSPWASACQTPIDSTSIINRGTGRPAWSLNSSSSATSKYFTDDTIVESFHNGMFSFDFANGTFSFDFADTDTLKGLIKLFCVYSECRFDRHDTHTPFIKWWDKDGSPAAVAVDAFTPSATPEPGTWILFATGIFAFVVIRFGRKRSGATPLT